MNSIDSTKTIVGSLIKSLDKARIYGKIGSFEDLYLLKIINDYLNSCSLNPSFDTKKQLTEIINKIRYKNSNICIYRTGSDDFVNVKNDNRVTDLNSQLFKVVNTAPTIDDNEINL